VIPPNPTRRRAHAYDPPRAATSSNVCSVASWTSYQTLVQVLWSEYFTNGLGGKIMKLTMILTVAAAMSMLPVAPAAAQKDAACVEKCNRDNIKAGGGTQTRGTAQAVRACLAACPRAKK
jgi:hypothetical protein